MFFLSSLVHVVYFPVLSFSSGIMNCFIRFNKKFKTEIYSPSITLAKVVLKGILVVIYYIRICKERNSQSFIGTVLMSYTEFVQMLLLHRQRFSHVQEILWIVQKNFRKNEISHTLQFPCFSYMLIFFFCTKLRHDFAALRTLLNEVNFLHAFSIKFIIGQTSFY